MRGFLRELNGKASPLRWVLLVRCNPEGKYSFTQPQFPERWVLLHSGFSNSRCGENPSRISCGTSRIPPPTTVGSKNIEGVNPFGNTDYLPVRWLRRHRAALPPRYSRRPEGRGLPRNLVKTILWRLTRFGMSRAKCFTLFRVSLQIRRFNQIQTIRNRGKHRSQAIINR